MIKIENPLRLVLVESFVPTRSDINLIKKHFREEARSRFLKWVYQEATEQELKKLNLQKIDSLRVVEPESYEEHNRGDFVIFRKRLLSACGRRPGESDDQYLIRINKKESFIGMRRDLCDKLYKTLVGLDALYVNDLEPGKMRYAFEWGSDQSLLTVPGCYLTNFRKSAIEDYLSNGCPYKESGHPQVKLLLKRLRKYAITSDHGVNLEEVSDPRDKSGTSRKLRRETRQILNQLQNRREHQKPETLDRVVFLADPAKGKGKWKTSSLVSWQGGAVNGFGR